jgi:hypothetical protein
MPGDLQAAQLGNTAQYNSPETFGKAGNQGRIPTCVPGLSANRTSFELVGNLSIGEIVGYTEGTRVRGRWNSLPLCLFRVDERAAIVLVG